MPYQGSTTEAVGDAPCSHDDVHGEDEEDTIDPPASRGADLLLSLTKDRKPVVITPMDSVNACFSGGMTRICSNSNSSSSSSISTGSSARKDSSRTESHHQPHRLLYHSPIKVNSSSQSKQGSSCGSDGSEIVPYSMVGRTPAWSPSSLDGMGPVFHASFGGCSPSMPVRHMHFDESQSHRSTGSIDGSANVSVTKRSREQVEEKKEGEDDVLPNKPTKQRLISPSSSNEKPEDETESSSMHNLSASNPKGHFPYPWGTPHHPPPHHLHPMYMVPPPPPHWLHKGYPPPPHAPYPPPPPHYAMYPPPYPPHPWAMYGPPPPPAGGPPHPSAPFRMQMQPEHQAEKGKETGEATKPIASNPERCILVQNPVPNKYWSNNVNSHTDRPLPDFTRLVNFPDFLSRGRQSDKSVAPDGLKPCVMCGQMRRCSVSLPPNENGGHATGTTGRRSKQSAESNADEKAPTTHIIPRQNKGVCTVCDVAVWLFREADCGVTNGGGVEIKWCKGCKNFRPWSAFGEKGAATKCARCRQRQREKYAFQKSETISRMCGDAGDAASTM